MTDIFHVTIDSVRDATLRARVYVINPDVPDVPEEPTFPLALLADVWWMLDNGNLTDDDDDGHRPQRCPFSPERGREILAGMAMGDELGEVFGLIVGRLIRITEYGYLLADDAKTLLEPRRKAKDVYGRLLGVGRDDISRYAWTPSDPVRFDVRTAEIVTSYERGPLRNVPLWSEAAAFDDPDEPWEEGEREKIAGLAGTADLSNWRAWPVIASRALEAFPYRDFTVTVSHPGYLEHLAAGMSWSTTHTGRV
ncbi:hypothetical protein [Streptomyces hainanensis]|uniref:Uncharacterized protein n=1 Tax=Streptomyces hainanensis TaxID=402648 RepID=A0A4R4TAN4_9ACTN|nr:hypothetical protein [Streptomyces hainanensis]TDC72554.1 hypothetical protein E1283_21430 [Streptomyces hainanensis]